VTGPSAGRPLREPLAGAPGWSLILPLKPVHLAKSRLVGLTDVARRDLVIAMARDVCAVALSCDAVTQVVVVTRDPEWRQWLDTSRIRFVAESAADSLNESLRAAAAACRLSRPDLGIASLTADLPALSREELDAALAGAETSTPSFVSDAAGSGTTLLAAPTARPFVPRYGLHSRMRHLESGLSELQFPVRSGIRQDVDTMDDLRRALDVGVGQHTRAAVAAAHVDPRSTFSTSPSGRRGCTATAGGAESQRRTAHGIAPQPHPTPKK
jgi:2-phospho-L-lactate guanylyltransferase